MTRWQSFKTMPFSYKLVIIGAMPFAWALIGLVSMGAIIKATAQWWQKK